MVLIKLRPLSLTLKISHLSNIKKVFDVLT